MIGRSRYYIVDIDFGLSDHKSASVVHQQRVDG